MDWHPIETVWNDAPSEVLEANGVRYIWRVLVFGHTWDGDPWRGGSPYDQPTKGRWSDETTIVIAGSYEGAPCWTVESSGPNDYDEYIRPTHWMPLPAPPS